MLSRADTAVLKLMVSGISEQLNIREISRKAGINYRLAHDSVEKLEKEGLILIKKTGTTKLCRINLEKDADVYAYIEGLRKKDFIGKHKEIAVIHEQIKGLAGVFFAAVVFGSYAKGSATARSDIDIVFIIPDSASTETFERTAASIFDPLNYRIHAVTVKEGEFMEMLKNPEEFNVANEAVKNHIILFGAEQFYRMLKK